MEVGDKTKNLITTTIAGCYGPKLHRQSFYQEGTNQVPLIVKRQ